ncbi:hypothetical protein [Nitrospira moscoviensis]|nr:hypothetical protein [Nitrospira moscoviensis]
MAIDVGQIHNVVRTYQRALEDKKEPAHPKPESPVASREDRVSISEEARQHAEHSRERGQKA